MADQNENDMSMEEILSSIRKIIATDDDMAANDKSDASANKAKATLPAQETKKSEPTNPVAEPVAEKLPPPPEEDDVLELTNQLTEDGHIINVKDNGPIDVQSSTTEEHAPEEIDSDVLADLNHLLDSSDEDFPTPEDDELEEVREKTTHADDEEHVLDIPEKAEKKEAPVTGQKHAMISGETAAATGHSLKGLKDMLHKQRQPQQRQPQDIPTHAGEGNMTVDHLVSEALKPLLKEWIDKHLPHLVEKIVEQEIKRLIEKSTD